MTSSEVSKWGKVTALQEIGLLRLEEFEWMHLGDLCKGEWGLRG